MKPTNKVKWKTLLAKVVVREDEQTNQGTMFSMIMESTIITIQ